MDEGICEEIQLSSASEFPNSKGVHLSEVNWEKTVYWHLKIGIGNPEPQEFNKIPKEPEKQEIDL